MKPIKRYYLDDGTQSDKHYLDVAQRLVDSILEHPYSSKQHQWREWLNECGEILRYRMFKNQNEDI